MKSTILHPDPTEPKVAIIDYHMGNMFSVQQACVCAGLFPVPTSDSTEIAEAEAAILPGVGAFGEAMNNLKHLDLVSPIRDFIQSGKPFIGICLGLQLLFTESEEFGVHKGLGIIDGCVIKFPSKSSQKERITIPHMGWNQIFNHRKHNDGLWNSSLLHGVQEGSYMYFVHSYYAIPSSEDVRLTVTDYEGIRYCSCILRENIFATQFHPEKSAHEGIKIYHNLKHLIISERSKEA
jgi:glutamine amidotransferase